MTNYGRESRSFAHDVFLSFRGQDTRHTFVKDLRQELWRRGFNIFIDDNDKDMRIGEGISDALSKAIEESQISIIVLSDNYATSTWCLDELVEILDLRKRNNRQHVVPIFYHVDPSDVRHQRKSYGKAITAQEIRFGKNSEKVQTWRSALSEIGSIQGLHITPGSEINFIEKIVEEVRAKISRKPSPIGRGLIGLENRIEEVKSILDMKPIDDTVCMLGIYGLGGVGKTELVKALYSKIGHQFDSTSFLENVREKYKKINGLEVLQKILLSEMREQSEPEFDSTNQGNNDIKNKLGNKKVLLVLDDIDDREQINNLAGGCDWFGSGSRIIITTRDEDLLINHQVKKVYKMTELNDQHSLELFCQNAFRKSHPEPGYEDMTSRAVGYAKGLPLALKIIGSDLATQKSLEAWACALKEYERIPKANIQDKLKISYDRLKDHAKHIFLDISCFFKGERKKYVQEILKEFDAAHNIEVLAKKSLLTIEHGYLKMHDLIQDMGREIVRKEAPNPCKRSRLWFYEDILDVLTEDVGSDALQGIMLDPPQQENVDWSGVAFEKMKYLRILIVRNTSFSPEPKHLPNHLRLLDWEKYPSKSFPPKFYPTDIIVFNLCESNLTLEEPFKNFSSLTYMNFSHSQSITTIPDVSKVQNLRELRLDNCNNLIEVHESVGFLKNLAHFGASGCTKLRTFLQKLFLPSLEVLNLNFCIKLERFPEIENEMNKPLRICMIHTAIEELPDSIGNLTGLVCIEITSSEKLRYLPSSLFMLPNVVAFKIGGCSQLRESFTRFLQSPSVASDHPTLRTLDVGNGGLIDEDLRAILQCFPKLEDLIASENNFESLPECIEESFHLTSLDVSVCRKLRKIPKCTNLRILNVHQCMKLEHISELPSTIQKIDVRYCYSLSNETSTMLWSQVSKEIRRLEIVMPQTEIPEWFPFGGDGGNPHFWARGKFPVVALALVFHDVNNKARQSRRQLVELELVINGQRVPCKAYHNFIIAPDHVLVCDLRLLFSDEQWLDLDAFLEHDWNLVQISYDSTMMLSSWGVFVYKQGTNMEDVQFTCPDPKYSFVANTSQTTIPTKDPKKEQRKMIVSSALDQMFDGMLKESKGFAERNDFVDKDFAVEQMYDLMGNLKEISEEAKDVINKGKALDDKNSALARIMKTIMNGKINEPVIFSDKNLALIPVKNVGEASTSGHQGSLEVQGSDPQQEEIMNEIFFRGMWDGLLEAQRSFPALDIDTTMSVALSKGDRVECSLLPVEMKMYMKGIVNGLHEAKLSFPTLDIQATLTTVLSRVSHKGPVEAPPPMVQQVLDWTEVRVPSSDDAQAQAGKEGCKGVTTKYEKLGDVLKGRAEELRGLYDAGIEQFQNSEEIQDLMSAVYLNGLRDGLLEAQAVLIALDMETTTPVFKENEEHATDGADKEENVTHEAADNENS